ncbi:MAG: VWA domain-containing protein [Saprospiraceae bacterium]|nr:VWA domain-containing protein [Pyrinomonadaceae bacterium]
MKAFLSAVITAVVFSMNLAAQQQNEATRPAAVETLSVSYGIVVDNSGSYRLLLDKITKLTADLVEDNRSEDETFLVTFVSSEKVVLRQDFTIRKGDIHDAADNMYIEGGLTAILDAVKFSAEHLAANARTEPGRSKALVLITDGDERKSVSSIDDVLKVLKGAKIRVFVIAIADGKIYTKVIDRLTKETGGTKYLPKTSDEITAAVKELNAAIRKN